MVKIALTQVIVPMELLILDHTVVIMEKFVVVELDLVVQQSSDGGYGGGGGGPTCSPSTECIGCDTRRLSVPGTVHGIVQHLHVVLGQLFLLEPC